MCLTDLSTGPSFLRISTWADTFKIIFKYFELNGYLRFHHTEAHSNLLELTEHKGTRYF